MMKTWTKLNEHIITPIRINGDLYNSVESVSKRFGVTNESASNVCSLLEFETPKQILSELNQIKAIDSKIDVVNEMIRLTKSINEYRVYSSILSEATIDMGGMLGDDKWDRENEKEKAKLHKPQNQAILGSFVILKDSDVAKLIPNVDMKTAIREYYIIGIQFVPQQGGGVFSKLQNKLTQNPKFNSTFKDIQTRLQTAAQAFYAQKWEVNANIKDEQFKNVIVIWKKHKSATENKPTMKPDVNIAKKRTVRDALTKLGYPIGVVMHAINSIPEKSWSNTEDVVLNYIIKSLGKKK